MNNDIKNSKLIVEEKKAIVQFISLFYLFFIGYDLYWQYILPRVTSLKGLDNQGAGLGPWLYVLVFSLVPVCFYFFRYVNPYSAKYVFLFSYIIIDIIDNLLKYYGTSVPFASGNVVELLFLFFSPIFVDKKFFWSVSLGITGKYILLGVVLKTTNTISPAVITFILSAIGFIVLNRFYSYINSLTSIYQDLKNKEKLAVIGQMATAIGHEIRNPLSSLKGFTQLQKEKDLEDTPFYPIMLQEIDRINLIVNDLMYLGKPRAIQFEKANIEELITYVVAVSKHQAEGQGIKIEKEIEGQFLTIECDKNLLIQVFINLIKNAIEAMQNGGRIVINISNIIKKAVKISVLDEGFGINPEDIPNLGSPFFTTKKDGTGLGLMVTKQVIRDHGGELKIESALGEGTKISVILPISQKNVI